MTSITRTNGSYVQLFVYRVPKKNHEAMAETLSKLAGIFKKHGILSSQFFQLGSAAAFKGFNGIATVVPAVPDEEVWLELEFYKDPKHKDEVVARINKDASAGPLFGQVFGLVTPGSSSLQGDFNSLRI